MVHHLVAAFIVQADRILLGQRSPRRDFYPNVWDVFGGHIEPEEQPDQTLVRETEEELGITPVQWTKLEIIRDSVPDRDNMPYHDLIVHVYCVVDWSGTPVNRQPEEHSVIQWFSYDEAVQLELAHHSYPRLFAQCLQIITGNQQ
ncbi:MAG TPA: NUDIX hydrolase [Anaerolineales bacterium]|nr:NUDIX hydrolase [Anaerolineales bacterium]